MAQEDRYQWLEEVEGEKCIEWVKRRNAETLSTVGDPESDPVRKRILEVMDSKEKIAYVNKVGEHYYNFWRDADHVRGIWRRTTLEEYRKPAAEVNWELVLDVDELGKQEGQSYVWAGKVLLDEGPEVTPDLCLVRLSPGGSDAVIVREFSLQKKAFVPEEEGGFRVSVCKSRVSYKSKDVLLIGTDTGKAGDMTDSGYPRTAREWKRGTKLEDAPVVYEVQQTDIAGNQGRYYDRGVWHEERSRAITFYTSQYHWLHQGDWKEVKVPEDITVSTFKDSFMFKLRKEWTVAGKTFAQGTLLAIKIDKFFAGDLDSLTVLFAPTENESMEDSTGTLNFLIVTVLQDVKIKFVFWQYKDGEWVNRGQDAGMGLEDVSLGAVHSDESDEIFATISGYARPTSLFLTNVEELIAGRVLGSTPLKALPAFFNAEGLEVQQHFATSLDGTKVPYFQVSKAGIELNGENITLLYGYGGFEISLTPGYFANRGVAWLEKGGVWVDANIRGGGEYGPRWHQAALKENRNKAYEDFEAVAEDLIRRGVARTGRLGIMGGSNGGLLMGNMITRPRAMDLFGACVCQVPLLDMKRYNKLLAGASWMGEYGDPDTEDWDKFLHKYSAYQNVKEDSKYPPTLFITSTKDDRVHPGHARKMTAKLLDHPNAKTTTYYYENIEGGHGGAADNKQKAFMDSLQYAFLWQQLSK